MSELRYSVIMPVYNKGPHVARAVASVFAQSFADFELLVIDDACTDESMAEVARFDDPRLRILRRPRPGPGGYAARNLGAREAEAGWLAFLDADDEWHPDFLQTVDAARGAFPGAAMVGTGWTIKEPGGTRLPDAYRRLHLHRGRHSYDVQAYLLHAARRAVPVLTSAVAVNRPVFLQAGGFPEDPRFNRGGDHDAWLRIMLCGRQGAWDPLSGATYHRDARNRVIRRHAPRPRQVPLLHTLARRIAAEPDPVLRDLLRSYRRTVRRQALRDMADQKVVSAMTKVLGEKRCNTVLAAHFRHKARRWGEGPADDR
jgi:glycosyltransferase involved in cell wall biosynthesis